MSRSRDIPITGVGAICGAGLNVDAVWDAIVNGRSAIAPIEQWDARRWPVPAAAVEGGHGDPVATVAIALAGVLLAAKLGADVTTLITPPMLQWSLRRSLKGIQQTGARGVCLQ